MLQIILYIKCFEKRYQSKWEKVDEKYILSLDDEVEMFLYDDKFKEFTETKSIYEVNKTFSVLYEDKHVLIVFKPAGL